MTKDVDLLKDILDSILYEENGGTDITQEDFDLTDIFVDRYFKIDFTQVIIDSLQSNSDLRKVGTLLDILIWSTPDNGTKLDSLIHDWITSNDKTKIEILLLREEWFPRTDRDENTKVLESVKQKFPEFTDLCKYYIDEFDYDAKHHMRRMDIFYKLVGKRRKSS